MSRAIFTVEALGNEADLTTPTSVQKYTLGAIYTIEDSDKKSVKKYMYVKSHDTLSQYGVYVIRYGGVAGSEVVTSLSVDTSATKDTAFYSIPCVAEVAFTSGYYGFVCIQGTTTVTTTSSVTILHACKLGDAIATATTEGATTVTAYTIGLARAAATGSQNIAFELIGQDHEAYQYTSS